MSRATTKQRAARAALTFLAPIPVSLIMTFGLVYGLGADVWGTLQTLFHAAFRSIGLAGTPYQFPWAWMAVFFLQIAFPHGVVVMFVHHLLMRPTSAVPDQQEEGVNWLLLLALMFVGGLLTLFLSRGWYSLADSLFPTLRGSLSIAANRVVGFMELFLTLAIPFSISCVAAYELSRRQVGSDRMGCAHQGNDAHL